VKFNLFHCVFGCITGCTTNIEEADCIQTDTPTTVYHGQGSNQYLAPALNNAIEWALKNGKFGGLAGLHSISSPNGIVYENTGGGDPSTINKAPGAEEEKVFGIFAKIAIPVAAVALFLLTILFLRRESTETTAYVEGRGESSVLDCERAARIVTNDDTVSSGPFDGVCSGTDDGTDDSSREHYEDSFLGKNSPTRNVHVCQSSLCRACQEQNRRGGGGISFVKSEDTTSSPKRLPRDSPRKYSARYAVSL